MRIELRVGGGLAYLPGLAAPFVVDTAELPPEQRHALERLVEDACVFDQPSSSKPSSRGADRQTYTLTIEDKGRRHSLRRSDPVNDPALAALIEMLQTLR